MIQNHFTLRKRSEYQRGDFNKLVLKVEAVLIPASSTIAGDASSIYPGDIGSNE